MAVDIERTEGERALFSVRGCGLGEHIRGDAELAI
jgi:hypothetical protein